MPEGSLQRFFFALWPDRQTAQRLEQIGRAVQREIGGQRTRQERLHLTLAFVGDPPPAQLPILLRLGDDLRASSFTLLLDRTGFFSRPGIFWLGADAPDALSALHGELERRLERSGLRHAPLTVPHVTLLRRVTAVAPVHCPITEIRWPVREFVLAASVADRQGTPAAYRIVRRWPLTAASRSSGRNP